MDERQGVRQAGGTDGVARVDEAGGQPVLDLTDARAISMLAAVMTFGAGLEVRFPSGSAAGGSPRS